ncbi:response regulator [uncultured Massilia sp.]|uniref:response regulator n=1 Tax=uncultured Massilia sp. TaxID=169973 RepID=UPI0025F5BD03|nr:response regulator [uncultured Massilia sp.]
MRHILLVDDEEAVRYVFERYLSMLGYRVTTARDGAEALGLHQADPADLIITDFRMPYMDGGELLARLRDLAPDLPAILISANPVDAGPMLADVRFFAKPVSMPLLAETVAGLIGAGAVQGGREDAAPLAEPEALRSRQHATA